MSKSYMERLKKYKEAEAKADDIVAQTIAEIRAKRLTIEIEADSLKEPNERGDNEPEDR